MVSATPIEINDPRFEEQGFQIIKIKPTFDYKRDINLWVTTIYYSLQRGLAKIEDKHVSSFATPQILFMR